MKIKVFLLTLVALALSACSKDEQSSDYVDVVYSVEQPAGVRPLDIYATYTDASGKTITLDGNESPWSIKVTRVSRKSSVRFVGKLSSVETPTAAKAVIRLRVTDSESGAQTFQATHNLDLTNSSGVGRDEIEARSAFDFRYGAQ